MHPARSSVTLPRSWSNTRAKFSTTCYWTTCFKPVHIFHKSSHPVLVIMRSSEPHTWFQYIFWASPVYCRRKSTIFKHNLCYLWSARNHWTKSKCHKINTSFRLDKSMHIWYVKTLYRFYWAEEKEIMIWSKWESASEMSVCSLVSYQCPKSRRGNYSVTLLMHFDLLRGLCNSCCHQTAIVE